MPHNEFIFKSKIFLYLIILSLISIHLLAQVNLDEEVLPEDLEVSEPKILPDSPFYFFKDWIRGVRLFFLQNALGKAKLRERFSNERLIELKKTIENNKGEKEIEKALFLYQNEIEKLKNEASQIKKKAKEDPNVESFLDKFIWQQILHQKLLSKLESQVPPKAYEKIRKARERHLENFKEVTLKLEDRNEKIAQKLDKALSTQKGSEFKEFKEIEILKSLKEKTPDPLKEEIQKIEKKRLETLQKYLKELSLKDRKRFGEYVENISGEEKLHLEIIEDLKLTLPPEISDSLLPTRGKIFEKISQKSRAINCPQFIIPGTDFCKEGRIVIDKDPKTGCYLATRCISQIEKTTPELLPGPTYEEKPKEEKPPQVEKSKIKELPPPRRESKEKKPSKPPQAPKSEASECEGKVDKFLKDFCYFQLAQAKKEVGICERIQNELPKNYCYASIAKAIGDLALCEKITSQLIKESCYFEVAEAKQEVSICEKIKNTSKKDSCYRTLAKVKRDPTLCKGDINFVRPCIIEIAKTTKDLNICEAVDQGGKNECYFEVAISKKDLTLCERINENSFTPEFFKGNCYGKITQDPAICEKLEDVEARRWCHNSVAETRKDLTLCDKIDDTWVKTNCYTKVAKREQNPAICEKIGDKLFREACYEDVAQVKEDPSICEKIETIVAPLPTDSGMGEMIVDRGTCYYSVATQKKDPSICERIPTEESRNDCYAELASAKKDITLCGKIKNEKIKNECYERFYSSQL